MKGTLFIISAPSGTGKTTLVNAVVSELKNEVPLKWVVTYTTKEPRPGDVEGRDYHFVSKQTFDQLLSEGFFMEYSKAYVDYYGSPASVIEGLSKGTSYIMIVDRVGALEIRKRVPDAILIWIEAPNLETLRQRLEQRGTESADKIERRLKRAQEEMDLEKQNSIYTYSLINDELIRAKSELKRIVSTEMSKNMIKKSQIAETAAFSAK
jgi:guanylate kinase